MLTFKFVRDCFLRLYNNTYSNFDEILDFMALIES